MTSLRILSLNLHNTGSESEFITRCESITALAADADPDLIGIQELTDYMPQDLPYLTDRYAFYGKSRNSRLSDERSCILYRKERFRRIDAKTLWLSDTPEEPGSKFTFSVFPRIVTIMVLEDLESGKVFTFANTHLDHLLPGTRIKQCAVLRDLLRDNMLGEFLILTGDFNSTAVDPGAMLLLHDPDLRLRNLEDPDLKSSIHGFLQSAVSHYRPIDLIMASDFLNADLVKHLSGLYAGKFPTDHMPLLAEISLPDSVSKQ